MKIFSLILLLITLSLNSKAQENDSKDYIIISGKIEGVMAGMDGKKSIELSYPYFMNKFKEKIIIDLKTDNTFIDTISSEPGLYCIWDSHNPIQIYLGKPSRNYIGYNVAEFENSGHVILEGDNVLTNLYYIEKKQKEERMDPFNEVISEEDYRLKINEYFMNQMTRLNNSKMPQAIKADEEDKIHFERLKNLLTYINARYNANNKFVPSQITKDELNIDYNDEVRFKKNVEYWSLVSLDLHDKLQKIERQYISLDSNYTYMQHFNMLTDSLVKNEFIKNEFIKFYGVIYLRYSNDKIAYYHDYQKYYTGDNNAFKMKMDDAYLRYSSLKKGSPSPEFNDYLNYYGGSNSLKEYRGKYVFIDVWASSCATCMNDLPFLKVMKENCKNKNIQFINLSVDKYERNWKRAIVNQKMEGIQLLVKGNQDPFIKGYAISSIPRYILIDPEGNIVDYNAPRPSDKEALDKLFGSVGL